MGEPAPVRIQIGGRRSRRGGRPESSSGRDGATIPAGRRIDGSTVSTRHGRGMGAHSGISPVRNGKKFVGLGISLGIILILK